MRIEYEGLPVKGYLPQSEARITIVNSNKEIEERLLRTMDEMVVNAIADPRWIAIARTQMEQAFMAWNRAVFQPKRVELPGDAA